MMEPGSSVGLVRGLVLREANVAVDAKHRSLGVAADLRCEPGKADVELFDQFPHRRPHLILIVGAVRFEPRLLIIPRELSKESQTAFAKRHCPSILIRKLRQLAQANAWIVRELLT